MLLVHYELLTLKKYIYIDIYTYVPLNMAIIILFNHRKESATPST